MARIWNCFGFPKLELENLSFSNIRKIKSDNNACSNFGLPPAVHPHSCAQPRAQLVEACALQKLGASWGSQNRNLKIRVFETFAKSKVTTMRATTCGLQPRYIPHSCAQPRAQLLEARAWHEFGTSAGTQIGNLKAAY